MRGNGGKTNKERLQEEIAKAVGAGRPVAVETVDFSDPNRPKTCIEVDFPILPINQIAVIEGNAGKPIYQVSKWWARRRSSVFRAMLLAAAMKAPDDPAQAAKAVWDVYYANHQKKGTLKHLKVADIFMGGGTTIVEGSRLGMQMYGVELNPVAWFIVKNALADVDQEEVKNLLRDIEVEVKPEIMPFYACDCPRGHKGRWTRLPDGEVMGNDFDALSLTPKERKAYRYEGPEIVYVFWIKHGPCQVTGCGYRTPIMSSPVMATKILTVKAWPNFKCEECRKAFDVEESEARMAPGVALLVADHEKPYGVLDGRFGVICPHCGHRDPFPRLPKKGEKKKVELSLLVHPNWLAGSPKHGREGHEYGGSVTDTFEATAAWNCERATKMRLLEFRGALPEQIVCPDTKLALRPDQGTVPQRSAFACASCGTVQDVLGAIKDSQKSAPVAAYAFHGYCPACAQDGLPWGGRFFSPITDSLLTNAAHKEWETRKNKDLRGFWPSGDVPEGLETKVRTPLWKYNYRQWVDFFNPKQLIVLSSLLKAITGPGVYSRAAREMVLGAFQQYLRLNNMFCIWNRQRDELEPFLSKNNFQPPVRPIENAVFTKLGRGTWKSCSETVVEAMSWSRDPWELVINEQLLDLKSELGDALSATKSTKVYVGDPVNDSAELYCASGTDLSMLPSGFADLVITDPPFGDIMQYSELSGFFYPWLQLALKGTYSEAFFQLSPPTSLEAVANSFRHGKDSDQFYQRVLTACWREAARALKVRGILAFTFHHDKDGPWIAVLESLFDAGFYLEATYPIRSDETKGEGSTPGTFGAQKVEYDMIHVCRKRTEEPVPISWAKLRREVMRDVVQLASILDHHRKAGLAAADLQVIKRGKALEYYSRHYGKVYVDQDKSLSVKDALVGINQLLDEDAGAVKDPPPVNAEPFTRQFLRLFDGHTELARDQMQKFLRGTGVAPEEFKDRGWCTEEHKVYYPTSPLEIARDWHGLHRRRLTIDYDQAMVLIGACFDNSGINAGETLRNENFRPHQALVALLDWHAKRAGSAEIRNAAARASHIYKTWAAQHQQQVAQMALFAGEE